MPPVVLIYQTCMFRLLSGQQTLAVAALSWIRIAITKAAQNSASVFTIVRISQFALNQETSLTCDVQRAAKTHLRE